jgi:glycosyltransferase involved in cell wall biosynthesis
VRPNYSRSWFPLRKSDITTILFVESGETGGGSLESLYQHLRVIDTSLFRPIVVCLNDLPHIARIQELGIPVHVLSDPLYSKFASAPWRWLLRKLRSAAIRSSRFAPWVYPWVLRFIHWPTIHALANLARTEQADLLYLNVHPYRDFFAIIAAQQVGALCISHLRSADPGSKGQFNRSMVRYSNSVVGAYVANSKMTRDYWLDAGLDPSKMHIVLNGITEAVIVPADVRQRWGIPLEALLLGVVGPLRNRYKIDEFALRAVAEYIGQHPKTALLVIGDGPMAAMLIEESLRLGIRDHVIMTGHQEYVTEIIAGLDVSLVMGTLDSFSRVAIESLQVGTPLVATDIGGIREILEDGVNGMLVPYGDTGAFVKALERIVSDQLFRDELVKNGQRTVRERLSVEGYAAQVSAISLEVMSHKQSPEDLV